MKHLRTGALLGCLTAAVGLGCTAAESPEISEELVLAVAHDHGVEPSEITSPIALDDEMKAWLYEWVRPTDTSLEQLRQVLLGFQSPNGLHLKYDPGYTGSAREVFESHRYNCLSFSHLFIAMARELGIDAYYLNVDSVQHFRREGDLVVVSGHITAGYDTGPTRKVLEFTVGPQVDYRAATRISDSRALAMYHANRGAELLRERDNEEALKWLQIAVDLAPDYSDGWINLGVARRRMHDDVGAEQAYRQAIEIDPDNYSGYSNLSALMRMQGHAEAAEEILQLLDRRNNRNPFIYLALGDDALRTERFDDARRFYRRAQNLSPQPETNAAMGLLALELGDRPEAERWLQKAREEESDDARVFELAHRLGEDKS